MIKVKFFVSGYEEIEIDDSDPNKARTEIENMETELYEKYGDLEEINIEIAM